MGARGSACGRFTLFQQQVAHSPTARSGRRLLLSATLACLVSGPAVLLPTLVSLATGLRTGGRCNKGSSNPAPAPVLKP